MDLSIDYSSENKLPFEVRLPVCLRSVKNYTAQGKHLKSRTVTTLKLIVPKGIKAKENNVTVPEGCVVVIKYIEHSKRVLTKMYTHQEYQQLAAL